MTSQDLFIERLLDINKYRSNIDCDSNWSLFPLRTCYQEELENDTQTQDKKNTFLQQKDFQSGQIAPLKQSRHELRMRKLAREAQLTDGWFGMKQGQVTDEAKNNYLMLQLKKYMDPKNPSKSSDFTKMPKFFQVGTVIDNGDNEGAVHKIQRGKRSSSLIDQFLEQDKSLTFSRRKFGELQKKGQKIFKFNQKYHKKRSTTNKPQEKKKQ